jgi:DNA-binding transcriptional MocR family regulator
VAWKREEMRARQSMAREFLPGVPDGVHPASPHVWWQLPRAWKPVSFLAEARARGIVLGAPDGFLGQPGAVPRAVRVCLGPPATRERLRQALVTLRDLAERDRIPAPLV